MLSVQRWVLVALFLVLLAPRDAYAQSTGTVYEDRSPKLATAGMVLTFSGLGAAGLGGGLLAAMVAAGPGQSYDELGRQTAMGVGSGLLILGGAATLTGIILWAIGESDVERERIRVTYPGRDEAEAAPPSWQARLSAGPSSLQLEVSF